MSSSSSSSYPGPLPNGGLYTGELWAPGATWRNYPARPDAVYMIQTNLLSANPPPGATAQIPGGYRPGNNSDYTQTQHVWGNLQLSPSQGQQQRQCDCASCRGATR